MRSKMKWGIRKKAAAYIIVLLILVSGVTLGFSYIAHRSVENDVKEGTAEILMQQTINDSIALNRNASLCMENYMHGIEVSVESAALDIPYHIDIGYKGSQFRWTSKYLLTQMNSSLIMEIMNGNISNEYYNEMIQISGDKEMVDSALYYFIHVPTLNYSNPHVNGSAYQAINSLGATLFNRGSTSLYDFLYSVMLPQYRHQLDRLFPIGDMLYSFRNIPDVLWSYYSDEESGFSILIPAGTYLSPLFNPTVRPWYRDSKDMGKSVWSNVYVDELTGLPMATCSAPVYDSADFAGVVGFDILLSTLTRKTQSFYRSDTSFAFLISSNGTVLAHPTNSTLGKRVSDGTAPFNESVREILGSENGVIETTLNGRKVALVYSTMNFTGWKFISVIDMLEMEQKIGDISRSAGEKASIDIAYLAVAQISVGVTAFLIAFVIIDAYTRRIERLTRYANEISMGNFDVGDMEPDTNDEMGELQRSFKRMVNSLKVALRELEREDR